MPNFSDALQQSLVTTAREAAAIIMRFYETDLVVDKKEDKSPVTEADRAANDHIMARLKALTPDIPVIAEEDADSHFLNVAGAPYFWLVDPLDGTKSFIKRTDEFTVNIGLISNGIPNWGVIVIPAIGVAYWTQNGKVFRQRGEAKSETIQVRKPPRAGLTVVASQSHYTPETDQYLSGYQVGEFIKANSSLKFCRVAEGLADLYPRFGPTMEWDTAAGDALLRTAGGRVEHPDGTPFTYGKPGFRNGNFVAYGF